HDLFVAPVGRYRLGTLQSASAAAAVVDAQDHETLRREHLRLELIALERQRMLVRSIGSAVDPQYGRILAAGDIRGRRDDESVNLGAVLALEADVLDGAELQLR